MNGSKREEQSEGQRVPEPGDEKEGAGAEDRGRQGPGLGFCFSMPWEATRSFIQGVKPFDSRFPSTVRPLCRL